MKKTTVFTRLLACVMTAALCAWGGVSCADGSEKDNEPQATSYTVTFDTDGGSEVASQTVEAGKTVAEPVAPTKDDYIFVGWYIGETVFSFTTPITADIALKARWVAKGATTYTVMFDTDGGTAVASRTVEAGKPVAEPAVPTKDGCMFVGWYNGDTAFSFTTPITADITLKAMWVDKDAKVYTVTFNTDGGSAVASRTVEAGEPVAEPVAPTKDGYTFVGWYNGDTAFSFTTPIIADIMLKAKWVTKGATTYTVMFDTDGGTAVASQTVEAGKTAAKPTDPTKEGYIFVGWYNDGDAEFSFTTAITADITLTAKWGDLDKTYYTVTFESDGNTVDSQNVESGAKATKPTDPTKDGYTFLGWFKDGDENPFDFTNATISENITLTAKWEAVAGSGDEDDKTPGTDPSKPSNPLEKPSDPVLKPVAGGPTITKASKGELETAYVEWKAAENAEWYNVYVSPSPANADSWVKLDGPLVRQYADYFRADALGLKEGTYDMKVVPVSGDGTEATEHASEATDITVYAHERAGYGFYGASASGAYNDDGTLRSGAKVIYITAETAKTVKATVTKSNKPAEHIGFQTIIDARQNSKDPTPLCFRIVGTVSLSDMDKISSSEEGLQVKGTGDITIEGVGNDGTIKDFGILIRACTNVEVRNLGILNCMDDGISIDTDNKYLWIHNNDIFYGKGSSGDKAKGDGALDTKGSTLITHSYNHFWDCGKCNLQGMKSEKTDYRITYHHNWYDHSDSRHPRIRTASVHIYNNYFDGNAKYGVGVTLGASAFVEKNYFRSTAAMRPMMSSMQGTDATGEKGTFSGENGGMIKSFGNTYDCTPSNLKLMTQNNTSADNIDCYEASSREEKVPATYKTKAGSTTYNNFDTAADMYEYEVDTPEQAKEKVVRYAGRVGGGDLKWEFNNATEDSNYAVIQALKDKVTGYTTSVVKIGGGTASGTGSGSTGESSGTGDSDKEEEKPVTPAPEGVVGSLTFTGAASTPNPVSAGITFTVTSSGIDFYPSTGKVRVFKGDSNSTITFTTPGSAEKEYICTLACFDKGSAATVSIIGGNETITGSIPVGTGKQGSKTDLTGTTGSVIVKLKGNTDYTIKQGTKEFGIVSVTITE